jgi:hypothetical protein
MHKGDAAERARFLILKGSTNRIDDRSSAYNCVQGMLNLITDNVLPRSERKDKTQSSTAGIYPCKLDLTPQSI